MGGEAYTLKEGTEADFPINPCSWQWVVGNAAVIASLVLDLLAMLVALRMLKITRSLATDPGPPTAPMLGGGPGNGPNQPGAGERPGQRQDQAREFAPFNGQTAGTRQQGFQPFQGGGQTL